MCVIHCSAVVSLVAILWGGGSLYEHYNCIIIELHVSRLSLSCDISRMYSMGHKKGMTFFVGHFTLWNTVNTQEHRQATLILAIAVYLQMFLHSWTKCSIHATSQGTCTCMCMCMFEAIVSTTQTLILAIAVHLQFASVLSLLDKTQYMVSSPGKNHGIYEYVMS